ncbi:MAG: hypothetical protein ACKOGA_11130 [Planctomycetaceae bacterium]
MLLLPLLLWLRGPWWAAVAALAGCGLATAPRARRAVLLGALSVGWAVLSQQTANSELFFPYCVLLAALVFVCAGAGDFWRGVRWSAAVLGLFFVVRTWQQATLRVLLVEFVVASALWELVMVVCRPRWPIPTWYLAVPFLASALAWLSLAL